MKKSFDVVGDREYGKSFLSVSPQSSRPFTAMPITYDRAYGGVDSDTEKPDKVRSFGPNPVGVGFYPYAKPNELVGKRLPNTEESGSPVTSPTGEYRAMSFGPVGRNFVPRAALAGTYDQDWLDNVFPFLPADFDPRYYQSAPPDQQIPYPSGGETFEMVNLTPHGRLAFRLPSAEVPIEFTLSSGKRTDLPANLDTVFIESDSGRVMLSWRASIPVSQGLPEVKECVVGRMPEGWYHARRLGKTYYPSIQHLSAARRKSRLEEDAS